MVDVVPLPSVLRVSDRTDPELVMNSRSGGVSLAGTEQIISALSGQWKFAVTIPIYSKVQARAWRAFRAKLQGRFNFIEIKVADAYRISRREIGAWNHDNNTPHSDDSMYSDITGHALAQPNAPLLADVAEGATSITISAAVLGGALVSGVFFSIDGWLYLVKDFSVAAGIATIENDPPLRKAQVAGDIVDFDAKFIGRLDADSVPLDLAGGKYGAIQFTVNEDLLRLLS
jgi:hypothetical protein